MEAGDSTGESHTLWREYDSLSARWAAPDPYSGSMELTSPQTLNRYSYVNNDPVNKVDPTGLMLSDIGVAQSGDAGFAHTLQGASDAAWMRGMNEAYAAEHNWILEGVQTQQTSPQQELNLINQAFPQFTSSEQAMVDQAITDAFAMVTAPDALNPDGCRAALISNFGPFVTSALRDLRTSGGVAVVDSSGNIAPQATPQNVFSGEKATRQVPDANGSRVTVSQYFKNHSTVGGVTVTDPQAQEPGDIYLPKRFFGYSREEKAWAMIHEGVVHRGNGRSDAEFAPPGSKDPQRDGSFRINEIIQKHCSLH
jgi:RHS repeat-associated protein